VAITDIRDGEPRRRGDRRADPDNRSDLLRDGRRALAPLKVGNASPTGAAIKNPTGAAIKKMSGTAKVTVDQA
jgi:hypothetical protein